LGSKDFVKFPAHRAGLAGYLLVNDERITKRVVDPPLQGWKIGVFRIQRADAA
jgi:hypothetical protein